MPEPKPPVVSQTVIIGDGSSNNVVIQAYGDNQHISVGRAVALVLTQYEHCRITSAQDVRRELDWLAPYARATPLLARERELEDTQRFLDDPRRVLMRVA